MATVPESTTVASRPRQFSLRALFKLTLIVSVLLTVGVVTTSWVPVSISVVLAVWFVDRIQLVAPRWLAITSIGLFGISLCLPAINVHLSSTLFTSDFLVWGWNAFLTSFLALPDIFFSPWLGNEPDEIDSAFAYLAGAAANTAFLSGYIGYVISRNYPRARTFARRAAMLSFCLVAVDFALLLYTGELRDIYPGFGFWFASTLALALGTRRADE